MKKLIFSFLLASNAIYASATEPSKLPAIIIDTLYHVSGTLVVEYEVFRPFEQVVLSVQASWQSAFILL